jgi:hypothetical protein
MSRKRYVPRDTSWLAKSVRGAIYKDDPRIVSLEVQVRQSIMGEEKSASHQRFTKDDCPTLLGCANRECPFGSHDLRRAIDALIKKGEKEGEDSFFCDRKEGTPSGQRMYSRTCMWSAKVTIKIEYPAAPGTTSG